MEGDVPASDSEGEEDYIEEDEHVPDSDSYESNPDDTDDSDPDDVPDEPQQKK